MATNSEEQLSALVDGELTDREAGEVLAGMRTQPHLRERWARYHLIRDGLRKSLPGPVQHDLRARVARALEHEPLLTAPIRRAKPLSPKVKQALGIVLAACVTAVAILGLQNIGWPVQFPWLSEADSETLSSAENDLAPYLMHHNESVATAGSGMLPYARLVSHGDAESEAE